MDKNKGERWGGVGWGGYSGNGQKQIDTSRGNSKKCSLVGIVKARLIRTDTNYKPPPLAGLPMCTRQTPT